MSFVLGYAKNSQYTYREGEGKIMVESEFLKGNVAQEQKDYHEIFNMSPRVAAETDGEQTSQAGD